ncbi:MAG: AAA family ATPase [Synergistaceae bacterium]|nr:AAA family ATPase [Synergistaceae bacterium]
MLQNVRLLNYRGLKDTTIPLAPITLLTGSNGIGKTSVLEGLFFLLSSQYPDAAVFPRYPLIINLAQNRFSSKQIPVIQGYDYLSFWEECPTDGANNCQAEANSEYLKLSWEMRISEFAELDPEFKSKAATYGLQNSIGAQYVFWEWRCMGKRKDDNSSYGFTDVNDRIKAVMQLSLQQHFAQNIIMQTNSSICRYVDMSSVRYCPNKLSLQSERFLTEALQIINPEVTGVRCDGNPGRLRVIINDESEYSLGTLGVGAETWASMLLMLTELVSTDEKHLPIKMFLSDEIGAGIHYSKLEEMWDFLFKFSLKHPQIQMVMTTHSQDCISAFCKTFQNEKTGMAHIVRLHKFDENEGVQTTVYPQKAFDTILSDKWEVRG